MARVNDLNAEYPSLIKMGRYEQADEEKKLLDLHAYAVANGFQPQPYKPGRDPNDNDANIDNAIEYLKQKGIYDQALSQAGLINSARSKGYKGNDYGEAISYSQSYDDAYRVAQNAGLPVRQGMTFDELGALASQNQNQFNAAAQANNPGSSGGGSSGGGSGTPANIQGLPPELQDLYGQLKTYLEELKKRGQVLNPNIEISPEKVAEFLKQAENEINPYYSTQLKLARDVLYTGLGYAKEEIAYQEKKLEQQYGKNLRNLGETAAEQGFAQSGLRQRDESELASDTQDTIDQGRRDLQFRATQAAQGFAQQFGTGELPSLNIGEAPKVAAGQYGFGAGSRQLPLYELSPEVYNGLIGSQEFARRGAVSARASELESAERTKQAIAQQRQLTL